MGFLAIVEQEYGASALRDMLREYGDGRTHDQVLRFVPALNIPRDLLDEALERIARVLRRVERDLQPV